MKIIKRELEQTRNFPEYQYEKYHTFKVETGLYSEKARLALETFLHFDRKWFDKRNSRTSPIIIYNLHKTIHEFDLLTFDNIKWVFENGVSPTNADGGAMYSCLGKTKAGMRKFITLTTKDACGQIVFSFSIGPYDYFDDVKTALKCLKNMLRFRACFEEANHHKGVARKMWQLYILLFGRDENTEDVSSFNEEEWIGEEFNAFQYGFFKQLQTEHLRLWNEDRDLMRGSMSLCPMDVKKEHVLKTMQMHEEMMTL